MNEFIIPLSWSALDGMTQFVDRRLRMEEMPTVLRLRTQMVLEELFSAVIAAPGADTAKMRCTFPEPRTVLVQYRSARADFAPDLSDLRGLDGSSCTYGLKLSLAPGECRIRVGGEVSFPLKQFGESR